MPIDDITGVIVSYNTKELLVECLESIRQFYPQLRVIIIDGSDPDNPCHDYVKGIREPYIYPVSLGRNCGHGKGMHMGIQMAETDHVLILDSDTVIQRPPLEKMLALFERDTFGVGLIQYVRKDIGRVVSPDDENAIPYLHPFFHIISKRVYQIFRPYRHHGAPCIDTMTDIYERGLSGKILKHFPVAEFVDHRWRGTRNIMPKKFTKAWFKVRVFGRLMGYVEEFAQWLHGR